MAVNAARGEVSLEMDGKEYVLRPEFETMLKIEDATGKGAMQMLRHGGDDLLTFREITTILWLAARESGNKAVGKFETFGEKLRKELGMVRSLRVALAFLGSAVSSEDQIEAVVAALDEDGEADADPSEPSEDPVEPEPTQE